jgi:hypothetical protein
LLWDLIDDRKLNSRTEVPMIIIAHSLGGTLAKQLFVMSSPSRNVRPETHQIHHSIRGYMFFGTLQRGSFPKQIQDLGRIPSIIFNLHPSTAQSLQALQRLLQQAPVINDDFRTLGGEQIPTICFYETEPTSINFLQVWQVDLDGITTDKTRALS